MTKINDTPHERKPRSLCLDCGAAIFGSRLAKRCKPCSAEHTQKMAAERQRAKRAGEGWVQRRGLAKG